MTRAEFAAAVALMAKVEDGRLSVDDFYGPEEPYRYAHLVVRVPRAQAPGRISALAAMAIDIGGHVSMTVFDDDVEIDVARSRPLDQDQIRRPGDRIALDVAVEDVLAEVRS